jgi:hypothetical protein
MGHREIAVSIRDVRFTPERLISLLSGHSFPVLPKEFPVNFHGEFRQNAPWLLRYVMMTLLYQVPISRFSLLISLLAGNLVAETRST